MIYVLDSAVALKWFIPEAYRAAARRLLDSPAALIAPDLLLVECAGLLWRKLRLGELVEAEAHRIIAALAGGTPELRPTAPLVPHALQIACQLGRPIPDCIYMALAEAEGAGFVTADRLLYDRLKESPWAERSLWVEQVGE
jgi:predicted nucleic acid-binding protein